MRFMNEKIEILDCLEEEMLKNNWQRKFVAFTVK